MDNPKQQSFVDVLYPLSREVPNIPLEDDDEAGETDNGDKAKYTDNSYPSVLTNFKIGARLNMKDKYKYEKRLGLSQPLESKPLIKRETADKNNANRNAASAKASDIHKLSRITREKIDKLKVALNQLQHPSSFVNVDAVEDNLRNILDDMGLVGEKADDADSEITEQSQANIEDTGELAGEDENLESGLNKIELRRDTHHELDSDKVERSCPENSQKTKDGAKQTDSKTISEDSVKVNGDERGLGEYQGVRNNNPDSMNEEDEEEENNSNEETGVFSKQQIRDSNEENTENKRDIPKISVANYQAEGETFIRNKRQEKGKTVTASSATESSDLMKGLEKSGELTVSGNKSPLASVSNSDEAAQIKKKSEKSAVSDGTESDDSEEERRIERDIQAKIDAIKEQVKREIAQLNAQVETSSQEAEIGRKKRGIDNLLDRETADLDPQSNFDEVQLPHIRKRRSPASLSARENYNEEMRQTDPLAGNDSPLLTAISNEGSSNLNSLTVENGDINLDQNKDSLSDLDRNKLLLNSALGDKLKSEVKTSVETEAKLLSARSAATDSLKEDSKVKAALTGSTSVLGDSSEQENAQLNLNKIKEASLDRDLRSIRSREANELQPLSSSESDLNNNQNRRRRQAYNDNLQRVFEYNRRKRANTGNAVAYVPYRDEGEEIDDEGDEADDDNFDDRTSELVRPGRYDPSLYYSDHKDATADDQEYDNLDDAPSSNNVRNANEKVRRGAVYSYALNSNNDNLDNPASNVGRYAYENDPTATYVRRKRHDSNQITLRGGGPMLNRASASMRERISKMKGGLRKKRYFQRAEADVNNNNQPQQIADMSDTDIFGPLPQGYEGELSRFKRVKRRSKLV